MISKSTQELKEMIHQLREDIGAEGLIEDLNMLQDMLDAAERGEKPNLMALISLIERLKGMENG